MFAPSQREGVGPPGQQPPHGPLDHHHPGQQQQSHLQQQQQQRHANNTFSWNANQSQSHQQQQQPSTNSWGVGGVGGGVGNRSFTPSQQHPSQQHQQTQARAQAGGYSLDQQVQGQGGGGVQNGLDRDRLTSGMNGLSMSNGAAASGGGVGTGSGNGRPSGVGTGPYDYAPAPGVPKFGPHLQQQHYYNSNTVNAPNHNNIGNGDRTAANARAGGSDAAAAQSQGQAQSQSQSQSQSHSQHQSIHDWVGSITTGAIGGNAAGGGSSASAALAQSKEGGGSHGGPTAQAQGQNQNQGQNSVGPGHLLPNNLAAHLNNPGMPTLGLGSGGGGTAGGQNGYSLASGIARKDSPGLYPPSMGMGLLSSSSPQHQHQLQSPMLPNGSGAQGNSLLSQQYQTQAQSSSAAAAAQRERERDASNQTTQATGPAPISATATGKLLILPAGQYPPPQSEEAKIYALIADLLDPASRETALLELSKKREMYEDLALVLWGGFGIMSSLLLEIVYVYPALSPPSLSAHASNRVCNALALLQCVASHQETRSLFLNAHIPLFLYPFLNTTSKTRPFEYLRLTSLGVIGALVKQNDNSDVINFLLSTEIIPLCLRIMETGSELSKTVAIFIVQKILLDDLGLAYICQTYERFYAVGTVLSNMVTALQETQAVRLLKHVVRCYLRLSDNPRAREALRACLPDALRDGSFQNLLKGDMVTKRCLSQLLANLREGQE